MAPRLVSADMGTEALLQEALGLAYEGQLCRVQFNRSGAGIRVRCPHHAGWTPLLGGPRELADLLTVVINHSAKGS